ncbi:MAG TPA: hypothetical protein VII86_11245, partial [Thermoanaerobaculia bacterium]
MEDLTILAALEGWIDAPPGAPRQDETTEMLSRLYIEVLGLIPYELAPVSPSAGAKDRLMAAVRGEPLPAAAEPAQPVMPRMPPPVPIQEPRPTPPAIAVQPSRVRRWPLALAATLALALLGLSGWLYSRVGAQRATIAGLQRQLSSERAKSEGAAAWVRRHENESLDLRQSLELPVLVSSLRPVGPAGQPPLQPDAHGMLFVAADHQHWYLSLQGLQPAPEGQVYKLWFMADRPVGSGSFTARPG